MTKNPKEVDWSLFESQEKEISTINNEICQLRKQKYPEYRDSYYRYYNEFGMRGMIGDLYRKFDRLKIMSESYTDSDIRSKEKEITDQFYDIISYCQLQLYWLREEKWGNPNIPAWQRTDSGVLKTCTDKDRVNVPAKECFVPRELTDRGVKILDEITSIGGSTVTITVRIPNDLKNVDDKKLCELITDKIREGMRG